MNSADDLKTLRNWALGVAGFSTTISAILVQALHFPVEPTLICVLGFACLMLLIVYLINKSEQRQKLLLKTHIDESSEITKGFDKRLDYIDKLLLEIQRSSLRIELGNEIKRHPENHDTILKMAERYFLPVEQGGYNGDWVASDAFQLWAEKENEHGRPVKIPLILQKYIKE